MSPVMKLVLPVLLMAAASGPASARVFTVGADAACNYREISQAVAAAAANGPANDDIRIARNKSYSSINLLIERQSLTLSGGYDHCADTGQSGHTRLEGSSSGPFIRIQNNVLGSVERIAVALRHVDLTGAGNGSVFQVSGGALRVTGNVFAELDDVAIWSNRAGRGGGIAIESSSGMQAYLYAHSGTQVFNNRARNDGGGISCSGDGQMLLADDVGVFGNSADRDGGGLLMSGCRLTKNGSDGWGNFNGNRAGRDGGAIAASNAADLRLRESAAGDVLNISGNTAVGDGGGLWLSGYNTKLSARGLRVTGNSAGQDGGGIALEASAFANFEEGSAAGARSLAKINNNVAGRLGGALSAQDARFDLRHIELRGNRAFSGAASYVFAGTAAVSSYMRGAVITDNSGYAVLHVVGSRATLDLQNVSIVANRDHDTVIASDDANLYLSKTLIRDAAGGAPVLRGTGFTLTLVSCSLLHELSSIAPPGGLLESTTDADPRLVDLAGGDFHLRGDSPAIDACAGSGGNGVLYDLDYVTRGRDTLSVANQAGTYDIGAYEYNGP